MNIPLQKVAVSSPFNLTRTRHALKRSIHILTHADWSDDCSPTGVLLCSRNSDQSHFMQ